MFSKILVPLDGSALSESVLPWLRLLASHSETALQVELVRCFQAVSSVYMLPDLGVPRTSYLSIETLEGMIRDYLTARQAELKDLSVSTSAVADSSANGVLRRAEECDLILMASHGAGGLGRWLVGSVASKVAQGCTGSILVVTGKAVERPARIERILVSVDGSAGAERAFAKAIEIARRFEARVYLYKAVGQTEVLHPVIAEVNAQLLQKAEDYLAGLAASVEGLEINTLARGVHGDPAITEVAEEVEADLLVMGSRNRTGLEGWLLGSQTERALGRSPCPVLIISR
jgi:nucleotide-binding universal stress UspA family protein